MLLPALALEYISGEPATFVHSTVKYYRSRNAVTGVSTVVCVSVSVSVGGRGKAYYCKHTHLCQNLPSLAQLRSSRVCP